MRRAIATFLVLAGLAGGWTLATGASDGERDGGSTYWVELDNAFGLIEGADVKVSGVRAGSIAEMKLDRRTFRALIKLDITKEGFGSLRTDTTCETRPQSLIGEYFVDCSPGKAPKELPRGATIPVERTKSTVPVDLVNNIMRRPYRERFSILLSELGVALAARGDDLDETIRRAVPALRETDKVLALLAEQRRTIRDLYRDADTVLVKLADNGDDVVRFVREARDTSAASAERESDLRGQFRRLPTFLAELQPTMKLLGQAADRQTPALSALNSEAGRLRKFLDALGPFSEASRPAFRTLAEASRKGRPAVAALRPQVQELTKAVEPLPEVSKNLAITLEHLDDPKFATEKDPRSPRGGTGYTGLEALLRYVFFQSQATNASTATATCSRSPPSSTAPARSTGTPSGPRRIRTARGARRCSVRTGPVSTSPTRPTPVRRQRRRARRRPRRRMTRLRQRRRPLLALRPMPRRLPQPPSRTASSTTSSGGSSPRAWRPC